jgi:hypothetical protein
MGAIIKLKMDKITKQNERIARLTFASIYPLYLAKIKNKGRDEAELIKVITWLTGFDNLEIQKAIKDELTFEAFFNKAKLNPNAKLIKGVICGYRIEDIAEPLTRNVRYLDKLVDELAKGRDINKIMR